MEFIEPPLASRPRNAKYMTPEVCAELDANPGQWAILRKDATESAAHAVYAWCKRHDAYEATIRGSNHTSVTIYVRRRVAG